MDIRADGVDFCANEFGGKGLVRPQDFSEQVLPDKIDLIWVGSVFTHIDFERAKLLFCWLFDCLAPGGLLVITTHGRYKLTNSGLEGIGVGDGCKQQFQSDYQRIGYAYTSYNRPELGEWGVSAMDIRLVGAFLALRYESNLILCSEGGWAGQDVLIFGRTAAAEVT